MATVTGTGIKVNAAVNLATAVGGSGATVNLYTAPANGYAIVMLNSNQAVNWRLGGNIIYSQITGAGQYNGTSANPSQGNTAPLMLYVGPGITLSAQSVVSALTAYVSGVEFINSP